MTEQRKPILCLDFDGVIHSYTSPWTKADEIHDGPVPGAIEFILEATKHFEVHVYSSRSGDREGWAAMQVWLMRHLAKTGTMDALSARAFAYDEIKWPTEKPPAFVTIDDRALTFTGTFPSIEELKAFKPWNKGGQSISDDRKTNKYRRKPTVIEAEQFTAEHTPQGVNWASVGRFHYVVTIQEIKVPVSPGEWIVKEADGIHYYPIADEEFRRIYEPVGEST